MLPTNNRPEQPLSPTNMSTLSRFEIPLDDPAHDLPPHLKASVEDNLQQLAREIGQLDPELAEIMFGMTFSTKTRAERRAQIEAWGRA